MFDISRADFANKLEDMELDELIFKWFDDFERLDQTESFILFLNNDTEEVTIIDKDFDFGAKFINWYKLYHVGRALVINGFDNEQELDAFLIQLKKELEKYLK